MSKMKKIFSCLSNDVTFPRYTGETEGSGRVKVNKAKGAVLIKGGANVQDPKSERVAKAPWVMTEITEEDFNAYVKDHAAFKRKVEAGFITVDNPPKEAKRDKSAPKTKKELDDNQAATAAKKRAMAED